MTNHLNQQITTLLDKSIDEGGRDDIAMDLSESDSVDVFERLFKVALDESDHELVRNSCIESIARILWRNKHKKTYLRDVGLDRVSEAITLIRKSGFNLYEELGLVDIEIQSQK